MAINYPEAVIDTYKSGQSIDIDPADLSEYEHILVHEFLSIDGLVSAHTKYAAEVNWNHRKRLIDEIRGTKFNGRLSEITVEPLDIPFDTLANEHSFASRMERTVGVSTTLGFLVCAKASSTSSENVGTLIRPIWLMRRPSEYIKVHGTAWRRIVGKERGSNVIEDIHKSSIDKAKRLTVGNGRSKSSRTKATLDDGQHRTS